VELEGAADSNSAFLVSLQPDQATTWRHHMFEIMVYVAGGRGVTEVKKGTQTATCKWGPGSVFPIPLNQQYRHISTSDGASLYCVNSAPLVMNLYHNDAFTWESDFGFDDRFDGSEAYYSGLGSMWHLKNSPLRVWETNFVENSRTLPLPPLPERGPGNSTICFEMGQGTLASHISEFPVGYKRAHRHGPGAHVILLSGHGYSLLWQDHFDDHVRVDWQANSVVVPPNMWWHQHFNITGEPARYLALKWGSQRFRLDHSYDRSVPNGKSKGFQLEPDEDDPRVKQMFDRELADGGHAAHA
jgi:quercetin dioxygenase-like cupin family protein